jgi:hypothetical protein
VVVPPTRPSMRDPGVEEHRQEVRVVDHPLEEVVLVQRSSKSLELGADQQRPDLIAAGRQPAARGSACFADQQIVGHLMEVESTVDYFQQERCSIRLSLRVRYLTVPCQASGSASWMDLGWRLRPRSQFVQS